MNNSILISIIVTVLLLMDNFQKLDASTRRKTVMAVILSQNEERFLPYFLSFFQRLTYPKDQISLFIRSGNNHDRTSDILNAWLATNIHQYHSINACLNDTEWIYEVKAEEALEEARRRKFDYFWLLHQKSFITNQDVLQSIIEEDLYIAAPLVGDVPSYYSNFWGKFTENWYYARSHDYLAICQREKLGCYKVALLHSLFLVNLLNKKSRFLTFIKNQLKNYNGPAEAEIVFAVSAKRNGIDLRICNKEEYGFVISQIRDQLEGLIDVKRYLHKIKVPFNISDEFLPFMRYPKPENFGLDKIYVINLARQPIRREIMKERMREVGLEPTFFEGIDSQFLNESYLSSIGYGPNSNYGDKYLTTGSIGCALSHYFIWEDAINSNYSKVLIMEDDVEFDKNFGDKVKTMFAEVDAIKLDWDLIYLDRYYSKDAVDIPVNNATHLVTFDYINYRATAYILSYSGLRKYRQQEYLSNILPVDEYLPLKYWPMENRYEIMKLMDFPVNVKAFSIHPLVVSHLYFGNTESDTENSPYHRDAFGQFADQEFYTYDTVSKDEL